MEEPGNIKGDGMSTTIFVWSCLDFVTVKGLYSAVPHNKHLSIWRKYVSKIKDFHLGPGRGGAILKMLHEKWALTPSSFSSHIPRSLKKKLVNIFID